MAIVRSILCIGNGLDVEKIQNWRIVSTFEDEIDISSFTTGCDVAIALGSNLITHLKSPQNPMAMKRIIGGPCYTYGGNSATATVFFEGAILSESIVPMKVSSYCEWIESKES